MSGYTGPPMWTDTETTWGRVSRWLHWGTAALVVGAVMLGLWLADRSPTYGATGEAAWEWMGAAAHHTAGLLVLLLTLFRANWRLNVARPAYPAGLDPWRRRLAKGVQVLLYLLLLALPISGWAALTTGAADLPIYFFGFEIPRMYEEPPATSFAHDLFAWLHWALWVAGGGVLALHLVGAGLSQLRDGDGTIVRMWRGTAGQSDRSGEAEPPSST